MSATAHDIPWTMGFANETIFKEAQAMHRLISTAAIIVCSAMISLSADARPAHVKVLDGRAGMQPGEAEIPLKHPTFTAIQWAPGLVSRNVQVRGAPSHAAGGSGLPTGKRQHKPLIITKEVDKATPLLARALETGTPLPQIVLIGQDADGRPLSVRLENVRVTSIAPAPQQPAAGKPKPKPKGDVVPTETISLNFEK